MDYEASTNQNQCGLGCTDVLPHSSSDIFGEETNSYSNKAVAQIKIPDTIVYAKADSYPIVKDICVDEGLYCSDKVSLKNEVSEKKSVFAASMNKDLNVQMTDGSPPGVQDSKFISTIDKSNGDHICSWNLPEAGEKPNTVDHVQSISHFPNISSEVSEKKSVFAASMNKDLNVQMTDGSPPGVQDSKFISTIDKSNGDHICSWNLPEAGEKPNTVDHVQSISHFPNISSELLVSPGDADRDYPYVDSSSDQRQYIAKEKNKNTCSTKNALPLDATESDTSIGAKENLPDHISDILVDGCSTAAVSVSDGKSNNYSLIEENPTAVESEVGPTDSPLGLASATTRDVTRENVDDQEILQAQHCSIPEMTVPDMTVGPTQSSLYHDNLGDFKFSGPKASSGHIAFSGNISMRSDSSTTSTRSFAFPILQTEWNTSPVKMAKARKHRSCWRMGLICCKF